MSDSFGDSGSLTLPIQSLVSFVNLKDVDESFVYLVSAIEHSIDELIVFQYLVTQLPVRACHT